MKIKAPFRISTAHDDWPNLFVVRAVWGRWERICQVMFLKLGRKPVDMREIHG